MRCAATMGVLTALAVLAVAAPAQGALYGAQPATGKIVTVNPATGAVTSSFDAPDDLKAGDTLVGLSGAEGGSTLIYRNDPDSNVNTLFRINPLTGAALSIESADENPTDGLSFQTAADLTRLIFSSHSGTDIHRQTGFSGPDNGNWATGDPVGGLGGDDFGREFGFFTDGGGTLHEYDPFTDVDTFSSTLPAPASDIQGLAFDGTNLYAATASGTLYTLNPNTGQVLNTATVSGGALYGLGVADPSKAPPPPAPGVLYGAQPATGDIVTVDPATGAVTDSFDAPDDLDAGETLVGLSGAEGGSTLIYRNDDDPNDNTLFRINPLTGAALSIESADENPTDGLSFQAAADLTQLIFSSHSGTDIHRQTGFSGPDDGNWATGDPVGGLGGDDFGREFGFFTDGGGTLAEYDPFTDVEAFKNTLPAPAQDIQGLAYDGTRLYAATASGTLYTLNPNTGDVLNTVSVSGGALYGLGVAQGAPAPAVMPSLPSLVRTSTTRLLRNSLTTGEPTTTFSYGSRPLAPMMGDWDGNGSETAGTFEGGVFKLRNTNTTGAADVVFTFGDPRGFPVAGDFNGDGTDDVAVFRAGLWQVRLSTGATRSFTYGSGTWPATVPVAGDWDGIGTDGIGTYTYSSATWALRNAPDAGPADVGTFVYGTPNSSYPVTGDWDGDGDDTVAIKTGATWAIRTANSAGMPDVTFNFGMANDLPLSWRAPPI